MDRKNRNPPPQNTLEGRYPDKTEDGYPTWATSYPRRLYGKSEDCQNGQRYSWWDHDKAEGLAYCVSCGIQMPDKEFSRIRELSPHWDGTGFTNAGWKAFNRQAHLHAFFLEGDTDE